MLSKIVIAAAIGSFALAVFTFIASYTAHNKMRKKDWADREKVESWINELRQIFEAMPSGQAIPQWHIDNLRKSLETTGGILAYVDAIAVGRDFYRDGRVQLYIDSCNSVYLDIAKAHSNDDDNYKVSFSHMIAKLHPMASSNSKAMSEIMLDWFSGNNSTLRENVLHAICVMGYAVAIDKAFDRMQQRGWNHSNQLICDALSEFTGSRESLALHLCTKASNWTDSIQVAIVKFASNVSGAFAEQFCNSLMMSDVPKEAKFALIRYFGRWKFEPVKDVLIRLTTDDGEEGLAIAATYVLRHYPGDDTWAALEIASRSRNWHVRHNAALSLAVLGANINDAIAMFQNGDSFAAEMLWYCLQERDIIKAHSNNKFAAY